MKVFTLSVALAACAYALPFAVLNPKFNFVSQWQAPTLLNKATTCNTVGFYKQLILIVSSTITEAKDPYASLLVETPYITSNSVIFPFQLNITLKETIDDNYTTLIAYDLTEMSDTEVPGVQVSKGSYHPCCKSLPRAFLKTNL